MTLQDIFGPPMAAPETPAMRRLRFVAIALAKLTGFGVLGVGLLADLIGRAGAGGVLLILIALTALLGLVFVIRKTRSDDRWLLTRGFDRDATNAGDGS